MFTAPGKMPVAAYPSKPPATAPSPTAPSSNASRGSSFSTYKASFDSRSSSISTATMSGISPSHSTTESAGNEQEEEQKLEEQAQKGPDYEKKKLEKEAFAKTYGPAIKEMSNFNMEYLHPESGQGKKALETMGTLDGVQDPNDSETKPVVPENREPEN
jgi:hypothetical protein